MLCRRGPAGCPGVPSSRGCLTPASARAQGDKPMLLSVWWRAAYWYGFVAQFTVLPFHQARGAFCGPGRAPPCSAGDDGAVSSRVCAAAQEFADSGAFSWTDRFGSSLRNNLVFYAVLAVRPAAARHARSCASALLPNSRRTR